MRLAKTPASGPMSLAIGTCPSTPEYASALRCDHGSGVRNEGSPYA